MQAPLKLRYTLAKLPSKNFIFFKAAKDVNHGVQGSLPILMADIKVEKARPNVSALRLPSMIARPSLKTPMLTFADPKMVFERVYKYTTEL